jgi:hypothetical protein
VIKLVPSGRGIAESGVAIVSFIIGDIAVDGSMDEMIKRGKTSGCGIRSQYAGV